MTSRPDPEELDEIGMFAVLRRAMKAEGGQRAFSRKYAFSESQISEVMNAKKDAPDRLLKLVGLQRVTRYRRVARAAPNH